MKETKELIRRPRVIQALTGQIEKPVPRPPIETYDAEVDAVEEPGLRDHWRSLRKHPWLVLGIPVVCTLLAAIYLIRQPDLYEGLVRVEVDSDNGSQVDPSSSKSSLIFDDRAYYNTQLEIIDSPSLLRRVIKTLDLENNAAFLPAGFSKQDQSSSQVVAPLPPQKPGISDQTPEDSLEAQRLDPLVEALRGELVVEPILKNRLPFKDTRLIDIRYTHQDPQIAAQVVNTIAHTMVLLNLEKRSATNVQEGDFLQRAITDLQSQIRTDEERLITYAKNNQILSLEVGQNTVVERLAGLNKQLLDAENERKIAEANVNAAFAPGAAEALAEENAKHITDATAKLEDLQQRRAQLLVEATEKWPEVKEIEKQIAVLEGNLQNSRNRATSIVKTNLETRYRQALAREQALRASFDKQRGETLTQNEVAVNYRIIQQEIESNKKLLDGFLQRSKENGILRAGTSNNILVIDYATTPTKPVGPKRLQYMALTLFLSLPFGIGLALLKEYLNNTVRSSEEVERALNLPALAVIPTVRGLNGRNTLASGAIKLLNRNQRLASTGALKLLNGNHQPGESELLTKADARSPLAEAFRQLRTSILLSAEGAPKTLLVTSSQPSEGKTTTAVNLAVSLAQTGANVLLIDADMRRPRLHSIFEMENTRGLSTILSGELSEAEVYMWVDQHASGLFLLPSGPLPLNPAELLGSDQMRRFLKIVEATFSYIIIDSPPITSFSDGVIISAMTDGVVLVVHGSKIAREVVQHSQKVLNNVGARILGVVLNNVDVAPSDHYYYQGQPISS